MNRLAPAAHPVTSHSTHAAKDSKDVAPPPPPKPPAQPPSLWEEPAATVHAWTEAAGAWFGRQRDAFEGQAKSVVLSVIDSFPLKEKSPFSTALLKHYVERSGEAYELKEIPPDWQKWIEKATHGKPGKYKDVSPYNSGIYDLRNSLGHFDVEVKRNADGTKRYLITDTYQFGFREHDTAQRGRHGFPLGELTPTQLNVLKALLPKGEYQNPGGFSEHWEVKSLGKETFLIIPQAYLAEQGKPFAVTGSFTK